MTTIASSLAKALPKPRYTGEHEELPTHTTSRVPRVVGSLDADQVVLKASQTADYHFPSMQLTDYRGQGLHCMGNDQDGAHAPPRTMVTEGPFQRSP